MFDGSLIEIATAATALALAMAILASVYAALGLALQRPSYQAVSRRALYVNVPLVLLAFLLLVHAFVAGEFSVAYVAQNSNSLLPLIYRLTATWGAHEGSLLLWLLYLVVFCALAARLHRNTHPLSAPWITLTLGVIQTALIAFILFLSSPFTEIHPAPAEGRDLNPLLQDPGLIFHPPLLYLGYVGFSVPFAFAIAALARGVVTAEWVAATRRWTLFSWLALTSGILLGGYWSYYELGWGGYWAWDPVENASFMPWLTATAFLHSVMAQERREFNRVWNLFLILATFCLSLSGTFLVRSGILTSVHAFAVDPDRGLYILAFLALTLVVSFGLLVWRAGSLGRPRDRSLSPVSRESVLLYNNMLFMVALFTVFFGTMLSLVAEFLFDVQLSVSAPYFNRVMVPIMLCVVLLMGVGPVVPWRRASAALLRRRFRLPLLLALVAGAVTLATGPWIAGAAMAVVVFAGSSILFDIAGEARARAGATGHSLPAALGELVATRRRRYGGLTVHFGILVIALGLIGSGLFRDEATLILAEGDRFRIGPYEAQLEPREDVVGPNYTARRLTFRITRDGDPVTTLQTEKRDYPRGEMVTTEAGIRSTLIEDLYLSFEGEFSDGRVSVRAYRNPLVAWIWIGWLVVVLGATITLSARRRPTGAAPAPPRAGFDAREPGRLLAPAGDGG